MRQSRSVLDYKLSTDAAPEITEGRAKQIVDAIHTSRDRTTWPARARSETLELQSQARYSSRRDGVSHYRRGIMSPLLSCQHLFVPEIHIRPA